MIYSKKYKYLVSVLISSMLITSPAYAAETVDDPRCGYIVTDRDRIVNMTDEDISFEEALDRVIDNNGKNKEDEKSLLFTIDDYTPRNELPDSFPEVAGEDELQTYLQEKYPSCRDQGSFGSCWAHSAAALAEFYAVNNLDRTKDIDLSEEYLAYGAFRTRPNPVVGHEEALDSVKLGSNDRELLDYGGNYEVAGQFLSKNYGYVAEEVFPYIKSYPSDEFDGEKNLKVDRSSLYNNYDNNILHLTNMYILGIKSDNGKKIMKEAIMRNGIVGISFYHSSGYYNTEGTAYYNNFNTGANHAICVVGWDDNYSVDNFNPSRKPSSPGAWLLRNSWGSEGSDFFDRGTYFWLSYEDRSLQKAAYVFDVVDYGDVNFDNLYYYDTQVHNTGTISYPGCSMKSANVFKVPEGKNEELTEITVEIDEASDYTVDIYKNLTDLSKPDTGSHMSGASVSGTFSFPGIYTISLNKAVKLNGGDTFSVVVSTDNKSVMYELTCSAYQSTSDLKAGQSFYFDPNNGGYWADKAVNYGKGGNFCISAHTRNLESGEGSGNSGDTDPDDEDDQNNDGPVNTDDDDNKNKDKTDNSNTDNGNTDNGNTDNGNTDNGKTDNGNTENGTTENGNTDNGKTDNGNTDNGKTDNGNTDNGNTDSGNKDNGNTDNGSGDNRSGDNTSGYNGNSAGDKVSENRIVTVSVNDSTGNSVELEYDTENMTYNAKDGKDVLVFSLGDGKNDEVLPQYQFTGKKITPGKDGYVVYDGALYKDKTDYTMSFKKNKNSGNATAVIKWKKTAAPYSDGKKITRHFLVKPRAVKDCRVDFYLMNYKIKKLTVTAEGITMKPKKKDYIYKVSDTGVIIDFCNNYSGTVSVNYS